MTPGDGRHPRDPREQPDEPRVVVRDKRRIDPSGAVREPDPAPGPAVSAADPAAGAAGSAAPGPDSGQVAELTETLQRLKAEYDNYRRRAERERLALVEVATGNVLYQLLPVLDDLERARLHGDLVGAFGSVGETLITATAKLGLEPYAEPGEPFDPQVHEAVMQAEPTPGATEPLVAEVFRPGYRHAGRVLRPAQVSVSEPADHEAVSDPVDHVASGAPADHVTVSAPAEDVAADEPADVPGEQAPLE
ncbi:MAG TPA: nucleotide exchange factor GrpE [Mycobacteriales bacterium]|nr:nucleotide exchange factor GrpE [Mycobacteriales bacterium]